jgi:hypothetical protein
MMSPEVARGGGEHVALLDVLKPEKPGAPLVPAAVCVRDVTAEIEPPRQIEREIERMARPRALCLALHGP